MCNLFCNPVSNIGDVSNITDEMAQDYGYSSVDQLLKAFKDLKSLEIGLLHRLINTNTNNLHEINEIYGDNPSFGLVNDFKNYGDVHNHLKTISLLDPIVLNHLNNVMPTRMSLGEHVDEAGKKFNETRTLLGHLRDLVDTDKAHDQINAGRNVSKIWGYDEEKSKAPTLHTVSVKYDSPESTEKVAGPNLREQHRRIIDRLLAGKRVWNDNLEKATNSIPDIKSRTLKSAYTDFKDIEVDHEGNIIEKGKGKIPNRKFEFTYTSPSENELKDFNTKGVVPKTYKKKIKFENPGKEKPSRDVHNLLLNILQNSSIFKPNMYNQIEKIHFNPDEDTDVLGWVQYKSLKTGKTHYLPVNHVDKKEEIKDNKHKIHSWWYEPVSDPRLSGGKKKSRLEHATDKLSDMLHSALEDTIELEKQPGDISEQLKKQHRITTRLAAALFSARNGTRPGFNKMSGKSGIVKFGGITLRTNHLLKDENGNWQTEYMAKANQNNRSLHPVADSALSKYFEWRKAKEDDAASKSIREKLYQGQYDPAKDLRDLKLHGTRVFPGITSQDVEHVMTGAVEKPSRGKKYVYRYGHSSPNEAEDIDVGNPSDTNLRQFLMENMGVTKDQNLRHLAYTNRVHAANTAYRNALMSIIINTGLHPVHGKKIKNKYKDFTSSEIQKLSEKAATEGPAKVIMHSPQTFLRSYQLPGVTEHTIKKALRLLGMLKDPKKRETLPKSVLERYKLT